MNYLGIGFILALAVIYGYLNGLNGSAVIVATMVSSRALKPRPALLLAAVGIVMGPFLLGVAVANTIGGQLAADGPSAGPIVIAALLSAILWTLLCLRLRIPSSYSQSLFGGLIGAVLAGYGSKAFQISGFDTMAIALVLSPVLGLLIGFAAVRLSYLLCHFATPRINPWLNRGQVCFSMLLAVSVGAIDSQKIMGMIVLGLVATGFLKTFFIPLWVTVLSAGAIGLGAVVGGQRLLHRLSDKFYKIRPIHGFSVQFASSMVLFSAAVLGGPVSNSQVITSAIVGAGTGDRVRQVRWQAVRQIAVGWALTLPVSVLVGAMLYTVIRGIR